MAYSDSLPVTGDEYDEILTDARGLHDEHGAHGVTIDEAARMALRRADVSVPGADFVVTHNALVEELWGGK